MINISNCGATSDEGLKYISRLTSLKFILLSESAADASNCKITATGLAHLRQLHQLAALKLECCRGLSHGTIDQINALRHLSILSLSGCNELSDAELLRALALGSVKILDLSHCKVKQFHLNFKQSHRPTSYLEVTGCQVKMSELRNFSNIVASEHPSVKEKSLTAYALNLFANDMDFYRKAGLAQFEKMFVEHSMNNFTQNPGMSLQNLTLLCHCSSFLYACKLDSQNSIDIAESPTFSMRIWRGICWTLKEFNRLIILALHLLGF